MSGLLVVFLVTFIDLLGFGIVIPILPYYAQTFGATGWEIGWLMTAYSLMQFLFSPIWGKLSDRHGRRPILLMSILGSCLSMVWLAFAPTLLLILLGRILSGIFAANISTAYAYVSDITTPQNRAKGMGLLGAAFGLGFTLGPALGGLLSVHGFNVPFLVAAGLSVINLGLAWLFLKESRKLTPEAQSRGSRISLLKKSPQIAYPVLIFFLVTLATTQMEVVLALYMADRFGFNARSAGWLFGFFGLILVFTQGGLVGRLTKIFGEIKLIAFATLLGAIVLAVFPMTQALWAAVFILGLLAVARGFLQPALSSLTSLQAEEDQRGAALGLFHSSASLARVLGPLLAGWSFDHLGIGTPFWMGSVLLALAFSVTLKRFK